MSLLLAVAAMNQAEEVGPTNVIFGAYTGSHAIEDFNFEVTGDTPYVEDFGTVGNLIMPAPWNVTQLRCFNADDIGHLDFSDFKNLLSITGEYDSTSDSTGWLIGVNYLNSIILPPNLQSIGEYTFHSCEGLTSIDLPHSLISISSYAFNACSGLTEINCYCSKAVWDEGVYQIMSTIVTTIHARASDSSWTAGGDQTIGGKSGITVIKDL